MNIKAIGFDIGNTLVDYKVPLSWKSLFPAALRDVMSALEMKDEGGKIDLAAAILSKYNTRENNREHEVSSDTIFKEILDAWSLDYSRLDEAKTAFYDFFQSEAVLFDESKDVLEGLASKGILMGFLTDVAYGMDNVYALTDIDEISEYFDAGFTSVDIGYRKTTTKGFEMLAQALNVSPSEMLYVGDEEKDVVGANAAGMISVLINRSDEKKNWGQKYTIQSLHGLLDIVGEGS